MAWLVISRYNTGVCHIYDLGIHVEMIQRFADGQGSFLCTRGLLAQADHFSPILFLFSPLFMLAPDARLLLLVQVIWLGSGVLPVYRLAEKVLASQSWALGVAFLYLANPAMVHALLYDFHGSSLIVTPLLWACWAVEAEDEKLYLASLVTASLCSEFAGVLIFAFGVTALLRKKIRRSALLSLLLAALAMGLAQLWMAHYGQGQSPYQSLYGHHKKELASFLYGDWNVRRNILQAMLSGTVKTYLLQLLLPLCFLPLLGPVEFLPALPTIAGNLLSWRPSQQQLGYHYGAAIVPFAVWSACWGLRRLRTGIGSLALLALLIGYLYSLIYCVVPESVRSSGDELFVSQLRSLPRFTSGNVSLSNSLPTLSTEGANVYLFPNPFQPAAWGNTRQALAEQAGHALEPATPGALYRASQGRPVQAFVVDLRASEYFPFATIQDRQYVLGQIALSGFYQEICRTSVLSAWQVTAVNSNGKQGQRR